VHAHAHDAFQISPILALLSPEKRCGKTTALSVIRYLVPRGVLSSNISSAAVFRIIDKYQTTLLVDEMDTFIRDNEELRGVINSSHQRNAAFAVRVSGDQLEPQLYSTWAPKVVAMIGKLPGTLSDRSIEVPLKRKLPDEKVKRFRLIRPGMLPDLNRMCIRWANDNLISLRDAATNVSIPDGLHDRAADNWEPLLAIADRAGGEWPERARKAALALSGHGASEDGSLGVMLLGDIKAIFEQHSTPRPTRIGIKYCRSSWPKCSPRWKVVHGRNGRASRSARTPWRGC
jgi:putative DNA primase/helicase